VKEFLSRAGVPYKVRDIDEDQTAYDDLVARGWLTVPVTRIGDRAIRGFDPAALRDALAARTAASTQDSQERKRQ
jgi:adenosylhomocysteine nucleosidase